MITIDGYPIDAVIKEQHNHKAKATMHPIERKADATDHVILNPPDVSMECVISNAPFGKIETLRFLEDGNPTDNAYAKLLAIYNTKKSVTIVTSLVTYTDMVIVDLGFPREVATGDSLRFNVLFQNLNFIDHERVFVAVASPSGAKQDTRGNKPGKKPPATPADAKADTNTSIIWDLTH